MKPGLPRAVPPGALPHGAVSLSAMLLGAMLLGAMLLLNGLARANPTALTHGRFKDVLVYSPQSTPTSFVLFLSSEAGWNAAAASQALELTRHGAMVVGIDSGKFKAALDADDSQCVFADGDLENLSHFVQAYFHNTTYLAPLLVGVASGASLAYAVLAQAPRDTFSGALTAGFCPTLALEKPLCKGSGLDYPRSALHTGVDLLPLGALGNPWVTLQSRDTACAVAARDFVSKIHGAALAMLAPSALGGKPVAPSAALPGGAVNPTAEPFNAAFASLTSRSQAKVAAPPATLSDLPVIEVAAQPGGAPANAFAIIMSGDGGWAGLDQDIAAALSAKGIPVVGLDSLRYYWTARTPDGLAADTDRLIRYYLAHFAKQRVLLIGYSQGADVLPFAVNRLPSATRDKVALTAILGMSEHALFEFHVANWISDDNSGPATLPEVNRISGIPVLCIYGEDEHDSLCPKLDAHKFMVEKVKGGHHFDGDYAGLAARILAAATP